MPIITAAQAGGANRVAFLSMVTWSEIGQALIDNPVTDHGYKTLVGATAAHPLVFTDYSKPPNVFNAEMNSTAAGAYQCLHKYAVSYIASLNLPDFGPLSQDRIALQLIRECRALPFIDAGNITKAIGMCASRWASLPGSSYMQHTNTITDLLHAYAAAGGVLA